MRSLEARSTDNYELLAEGSCCKGLEKDEDNIVKVFKSQKFFYHVWNATQKSPITRQLSESKTSQPLGAIASGERREEVNINELKQELIEEQAQ